MQFEPDVAGRSTVPRPVPAGADGAPAEAQRRGAGSPLGLVVDVPATRPASPHTPERHRRSAGRPPTGAASRPPTPPSTPPPRAPSVAASDPATPKARQRGLVASPRAAAREDGVPPRTAGDAQPLDHRAGAGSAGRDVPRVAPAETSSPHDLRVRPGRNDEGGGTGPAGIGYQAGAASPWDRACDGSRPSPPASDAASDAPSPRPGEGETLHAPHPRQPTPLAWLTAQAWPPAAFDGGGGSRAAAASHPRAFAPRQDPAPPDAPALLPLPEIRSPAATPPFAHDSPGAAHAARFAPVLSTSPLPLHGGPDDGPGPSPSSSTFADGSASPDWAASIASSDSVDAEERAGAVLPPWAPWGHNARPFGFGLDARPAPSAQNGRNVGISDAASQHAWTRDDAPAHDELGAPRHNVPRARGAAHAPNPLPNAHAGSMTSHAGGASEPRDPSARPWERPREEQMRPIRPLSPEPSSANPSTNASSRSPSRAGSIGEASDHARAASPPVDGGGVLHTQQADTLDPPGPATGPGADAETNSRSATDAGPSSGSNGTDAPRSPDRYDNADATHRAPVASPSPPANGPASNAGAAAASSQGAGAARPPPPAQSTYTATDTDPTQAHAEARREAAKADASVPYGGIGRQGPSSSLIGARLGRRAALLSSQIHGRWRGRWEDIETVRYVRTLTKYAGRGEQRREIAPTWRAPLCFKQTHQAALFEAALGGDVVPALLVAGARRGAQEVTNRLTWSTREFVLRPTVALADAMFMQQPRQNWLRLLQEPASLLVSVGCCVVLTGAHTSLALGIAVGTVVGGCLGLLGGVLALLCTPRDVLDRLQHELPHVLFAVSGENYVGRLEQSYYLALSEVGAVYLLHEQQTGHAPTAAQLRALPALDVVFGQLTRCRELLCVARDDVDQVRRFLLASQRDRIDPQYVNSGDFLPSKSLPRSAADLWKAERSYCNPPAVRSDATLAPREASIVSEAAVDHYREQTYPANERASNLLGLPNLDEYDHREGLDERVQKLREVDPLHLLADTIIEMQHNDLGAEEIFEGLATTSLRTAVERLVSGDTR